MVNRQKLVLALALSAGVCTSLGLYFYYRQQKNSARNGPVSLISIPLSLRSQQNNQVFDRNSSSEIDNDESESIHFLNETIIPDGVVPLTPDQASILTHFLYDTDSDDEEQLHRVLASIANASTFKESQINLANAGCINRLHDLLKKTDNETTQCKILLALHNLALNDFAITQFPGLVTLVINLCRIHLVNSCVRRYGLNLLINMSVLEYLHGEYMSEISQLSALIESTFECEKEVLSVGKILVNLSTNRLNLENLLKLTGVELKFIMNFYTSIVINQSTNSEDILLRYLTFYCNLADIILQELNNGGDTNNNNNCWLTNSTSQRHGSIYFEFFNPDKQILAKSLLLPQYNSSAINTQMKRLYQTMEKIRQKSNS